MTDPKRILVIRRDNIGDLVCTTPLLAALRTRFPESRLGVLANSYNAPVLADNPDIDDLHVYRKLKHLGAQGGVLTALGQRLSMLWDLRRRRLDLVVVAAGIQDERGARLAKLLHPHEILFSDKPTPGQHEVARTFSAARQLGITSPIPPVRVVADQANVARARKQIARESPGPPCKLVGLHISARRIAQRWPVERFADFAIALQEGLGAATMLFWSPGETDDAQHPGDDRKAKAIQDLVAGKARLILWRTTELGALMGGLEACDAVVCSDGGAMHIAAGLGKRIACFFGDSDVARWRPWGVPHRVLQATSGRVEDIETKDALEATAQLLGRV